MKQEETEFELEAALTYNDPVGGARVRAQGINCTLAATMFELVDAKGPLSITKDVPRYDLEALFDVELDKSYRVEITVSPVEGAER